MAQAKSWHPCNRAVGDKYDDAHLEVLFAGQPATWARVASWPVDRCDVIWLATRPGALTVLQRHLLVEALCKGCALSPRSYIVRDCRGEMLNAVGEQRREKEIEKRQWEMSRAWRKAGDVGWSEVHTAMARAASYSARAADLDAAAWAWEAAIVADCCGLEWGRQVELLLKIVGHETNTSVGSAAR